MWNLYKEVYEWKLYQKGLIIALLEESHTEYLQVSLQADSALMCHHEQKPQEPWRSRWLQERDIEQSAPTHACHTHCASRQLGTTANRRYDVPRDWLWDACQMARVCWGTCCKEFFSKEGPHYQIEQSARNPLERKQVWESLGNCPEAVLRQATINLYSRVWKSLGDSMPKLYCVDLAEAYVTQENVNSRICVRRKGMIRDRPMDVCMRNLLWKAEWGKKTGTNSSTRFPQASCFEKTYDVCQEYGGTRSTWYFGVPKRYEKTGQDIGFPCSQERRKETSK